MATNESMSQSNGIDKERAIHEMVFGKFLKRLICDYKDVNLSDGQIYELYQQCSNYDDFEELINTGGAEQLP